MCKLSPIINVNKTDFVSLWFFVRGILSIVVLTIATPIFPAVNRLDGVCNVRAEWMNSTTLAEWRNKFVQLFQKLNL